MNELNVSRYKGAQAWNRSCSVVNRRKTELSFAHARFLLRHYAHAQTDRAGIPDRVPTHRNHLLPLGQEVKLSPQVDLNPHLEL